MLAALNCSWPITANTIEYWWDNDHTSAWHTPIVNGEATLTEFGAPLAPGLHTLFMQPVFDDGHRGPSHQLLILMFESLHPDKIESVGFEYWIDNNFDSHTFIAATNGSVSFSLDLNGIEQGIHLLSVRPVMKNGAKGVPWQQFIVNSPRNDSRIEVYQYKINNVVGTMAADNSGSTDQVLSIQVPDSETLCDPAAGHFKIEGNDLQLMADFSIVLTPILNTGKTLPSISKTFDSNGFISRTATELAMNKRASLPRPQGELYEAVKMTFATDGTAWLRPSETCDIRILDANAADVTSARTAKASTMSFNHRAGTYYAIIHHADESEAERVDLKLMALDNKVPTPTIAFDAGAVTLGCDDEEATIRYTIDGSAPTAESPLYEGPFTIDRNYPVSAIATVGDMTDSDVAEYTPAYFRTEALTSRYNGRYLSLATPRKDATISYTVDGGEAATYGGDIELPGIVTVKAHAEAPHLLPSDELTFTPAYHYDGTTASLTEAGRLADAFEWCGSDNIASLTVKGNVNDADFTTLRSMAALRALDIADATPAGATMPADALAGTQLQTLSLPRSLTGAGNGIVRNTPQLTSLYWNAPVAFTAAMAADQGNPNLLLYISDKSLAPVTVRNVIDANRHADRLMLSPGHPFNCPEGFTAATASYTREFNMTSGLGECAGWETISLPFNVSHYVSAPDTECAPFAADGSYSLKPFWLYTLDDSGWRRASTIEAHKPYIISLPNNESYIDEWNLGGAMTFSATDVSVEPTAAIDAANGLRILHPTYLGEAQDNDKYVVNAYDESGEYLPGSVFLPGWKAAAPFECYFTAGDSPRKISIFDDFLGLHEIYGDTAGAGLECRVADGTLHIRSDRDRTVRVVNTVGAVVRTVELTAGEEAEVHGLVHSFYMVENIKVCVK